MTVSPPPLLAFAAATLAALAAVAACGPAQAQSQINRCRSADGVTVYTDKRCSDVGAVAAGRSDADGGARRGTRGCARNLRDLVHEVTAAIDGRDANRLGGVYHFAGMSHRGGYAVMDRLELIVQRPLIDIAALRPAAAAPEASWPAVPSAAHAAEATAAAARRPPTALRLEQAGQDGARRRTLLSLRRHMGCWWVSL